MENLYGSKNHAIMLIKSYKQIHQVYRPQFVPVPELPVLSAVPHHSDLLAANIKKKLNLFQQTIIIYLIMCFQLNTTNKQCSMAFMTITKHNW